LSTTGSSSSLPHPGLLQAKSAGVSGPLGVEGSEEDEGRFSSSSFSSSSSPSSSSSSSSSTACDRVLDASSSSLVSRALLRYSCGNSLDRALCKTTATAGW
jgi:hypothetical protein